MAESENKVQTADSEVLYLVPFDDISTDILKAIGESLKTQLLLEYRILPPEHIPEKAFSPGRNQYLSPAFLNVLREKYSGSGRRILGIADVDLFVPELNFVFGQADPVKGAAVISLSRLRQKWYERPPDHELFQKRALTEAVHELGHTYGLPHCKNPRCVMFFSNSLSDTDRKGYEFCPRCLKKLGRK